MSYVIIRNTKYKRENLKGIYRHNERRNKNYSNKNIDKERSHLNYSLKSPAYSYEKEFERIRKKYDLKGQIKKVSNIACEYIITSDKDFFEKIGEDETKRFFEVAYQFVCEYKNLGEQYILSAKVHMDEETPHLHLIFIPVVHTKDKKGNKIDKIACSEFWKERDSYRQLQDAFYDYITSHNFELERGHSDRKHLSVKEYKELTNFEQSKKTLEDIKLDLPTVPDIKDFNKLTVKRDEKIQKEIIDPKNKIIEKLFVENKNLHKELQRQVNTINRAEEFENEKQSIIQEKIELENKCNELKDMYADKEYELKHKYKQKISELEEENNHLSKIVSTFKFTVKKFIKWICKKFDITDENKLERDFEKETRISLDAEKQVKKEELEKEHELDLDL